MTPRQEVWLRAWTAVAGCWNQKDIDACAKWADKCLAEFDKRFSVADSTPPLNQTPLPVWKSDRLPGT